MPTNSSSSPVAYKLGGDALKAAKQLIALEKQLRKKHGNSSTNYRLATLKQRDIMDEINRKAPELLRKIGLDRAALQIEQQEGGHPRAYKVFPYLAVCQTAEEDQILLFSPVDYKGAHAAPAHSEKIADEDLKATDTGHLVYKRQGLVSPPLVMRLNEGSSMPDDFKPESGNNRANYKAFIAAGSSLACVNEFLQRREDLAKAKEAVREVLEKLAPTLSDSFLGVSEGDRLRAVCSFKTDANGRTEAWLGLINDSRGGTPVIMRDNDHFQADDFRNNAFRIQPNRKTEAGRKLGRLFDRLLSEPDLGQYWQLHNPTASGLKEHFGSHAKLGNRVPKLDTVRGVHYLVYQLDKDAKKDHCNPPGAIPVNLAEYLWLKADIRDEENFVRPADPPPQLAHMRPVKTEPKPPEPNI